MRSSGTGSGGGYGMNKHVESRAPKVEPRARGINPSAVNQLGNHLGDHVTHNNQSTGYRGEPLIRGAGYNAPVGPTNMMPSGPGSGREVMKSGQQAQHGGPAGSRQPKGRDILNNS